MLPVSRELVLSPTLLLLDEPHDGLAPTSVRGLLDHLPGIVR